MPKTKILKIDPKIFIGKPYTNCPKCKKVGSYGLLMVNSQSYTKRCKECWHTANYKLPPLDKKVIYLDQFVISNMMKAINEKLGKKDKVDKVYLKLFEKLDRLVKLQLVICPDSMYQRDESMLSFYNALQRMYEHLSNGTTFYDSMTIRRFQIDADFKNYIDSKTSDWSTLLETDDVLQGRRSEWQSKLLVSVRFPVKESEIESYQKARQMTHDSVSTLFNSWKQQALKKYKDFFSEFAASYGSSVVDRYTSFLTKYFQGSLGITTLSPDDILSFTGEESVLVSSLLRYLPKETQGMESYKKVFEYLKSSRLESIPTNEIFSSVWAAIAYQASRGGRIKTPNIGMFNDVEMVATLLPYCDAIFVDKDMYSILNFGEVQKVISKFNTKIFSLTNKDDFFKYLDAIENMAPKSHISTINKVYGKSWYLPFYGMYEYDSKG